VVYKLVSALQYYYLYTEPRSNGAWCHNCNFHSLIYTFQRCTKSSFSRLHPTRHVASYIVCLMPIHYAYPKRYVIYFTLGENHMCR